MLYVPVAMQGVKLELFIFDTFPMAQQVTLMEVARDSEFAPVKNAPGSASDSPDTARHAILSLHQRSVLACPPSRIQMMKATPARLHMWICV